MVTLTFTSPSTWRVFRQPLDSSTASTPTPPSPPKPKETPLVSQLVCVSQENDVEGEVRIVSEEDAKAEVPTDHCDIHSSSPPIPLRSHSFNISSRPRSFIASTRTKTFKRQSKPISMPRPPTSEGAVPSSRHLGDTLRFIASKKRMPKWWPRGDSSIASPIANDTSSSPLLPSRRGTSDEVLVLGNVNTADPIPPTLFPEVASNIPKTTVEPMEDVPRDTGNLLQMAVRQVELQRAAARRASADRLKLCSKVAAPGITPVLKHNITCSRQASLDAHTPSHTPRQIDATKSSQKHLPVAGGNVSFEILRTDAKAQQIMRSRLHKEENSAVVAPFSSKRRLSPSPPRSVARKAVPPVRKKEEEDENHLLQELTVDVKHQSNGSKIDQEAIAAFLNITTGSDVPDFLKVKVVDLAKEVQDWQKMGISARVKPIMQQQSKVSPKVSIDRVNVRCSSPPSPRGIRGPTSAQMSQESTQQQPRDLKSSLPTPSLHTPTVGNSRLPSRSTTPPSRHFRTSQAHLPPLPTEAASRVHMLKLQRNVSDATTQTSELEYITLIKERDKGTLTPMASKHPQVHIATTCSPTPGTQEVNSIACLSDALEELTSAPRSPPFDPKGENSTFLSEEESSLEFGSLGPPTSSSPGSARERRQTGAQSPVDEAIVQSATNNNQNLVPFGLDLAGWKQGQGHHLTNPVIPHRITHPVISSDQIAEEADLDKQFLTLLAETQVDAFPTIVQDATEGRNAEDSRSAASTPSFECVRVWRDNVAGQADRSAADPLRHQVGAKDVYLVPQPDVNSGEGSASNDLPRALRIVTHPNSLTTRVAHSVFYPSAATATQDSQSERSELESPVPTIRSSDKPGNVKLNATRRARDASKEKEVDEVRKKAEKRKAHVPNQHLKSTASSVLSWGTRSRRTLSESEAMRLFGPLGKRVEETSKQEGVSHNERVREIVEEGERGRKKTRSRNTFGLESVHSPGVGAIQELSDAQQQDEGQTESNNGMDIVRSKSKGVDKQWAGDGAFMLATTTTTTTTTATHSLLSVLRSPSPGAKGVGTVSRDDAPLIDFDDDDDDDNDGVDKLVNRIDSAGATGGNLPVIVRTTSHPPSTGASPSTPKAQDRLTMDAQRALHLIAHRIGKATQEMDSVKRDLMCIARAQRLGGTEEGGKSCILGAEFERGESGQPTRTGI